MNKKLSVPALVAAACLVTGCTGTTGSSSTASSASEASGITGSYEATVAGRNADLTVRTTFENGVITNVEGTDQQETVGVADAALEQVPSSIVENNSISVDTVTGATVTSTAIIEAVTQCITDAGGLFCA